MDLSDRVCQFYLRGRCQRENCEFKHCKPEKSSDMKEQEKEKETTAQEEKVPEAQAVAKKVINCSWIKNYKLFRKNILLLRNIFTSNQSEF